MTRSKYIVVKTQTATHVIDTSTCAHCTDTTVCSACHEKAETLRKSSQQAAQQQLTQKLKRGKP